MALSPRWPLVSTGTPATTVMGFSTTTRMPTGSELLTGVTRQAALLQPLTSQPKVNISPCTRFVLAALCVAAFARCHPLCESACFSQPLK